MLARCRSLRFVYTALLLAGGANLLVFSASPVGAQTPNPLAGRSFMLRVADTRLEDGKAIPTSTTATVLRVNEARGPWARLPQGWVHERHLVPVEGAIEHFTTEIAREPSAFAYQSRCRAYVDRGEYELALADSEALVKLAPALAAARANRGWLLGRLGETSRGLADMNEALRLQPRHAPTYLARGRLKLDAGDVYGAIDDYTEALTIDPQLAAAYNNRGNARADLGQLDGALDDFNSAICIEPKPRGYRVYFNRANVWAEKREFDRAIADYDRTISDDPLFAPAYLERGKLRAALGRSVEAAADFDEALRLDPRLKLPEA